MNFAYIFVNQAIPIRYNAIFQFQFLSNGSIVANLLSLSLKTILYFNLWTFTRRRHDFLNFLDFLNTHDLEIYTAYSKEDACKKKNIPLDTS